MSKQNASALSRPVPVVLGSVPGELIYLQRRFPDQFQGRTLVEIPNLGGSDYLLIDPENLASFILIGTDWDESGYPGWVIESMGFDGGISKRIGLTGA
ncbi:MAG: hypothetical protein AAFY15_01825 [Cyanobacteria bacterium J06648_11]